MEQTESSPLDERIDAFMQPLANASSEFIFYSVNLFGSEIPLIVLWLMVGGLFFTIYLCFIKLGAFIKESILFAVSLLSQEIPVRLASFRL